MKGQTAREFGGDFLQSPPLKYEPLSLLSNTLSPFYDNREDSAVSSRRASLTYLLVFVSLVCTWMGREIIRKDCYIVVEEEFRDV